MKKSVVSGLISGLMLLSGSAALAQGLRTSDGQAVHWRGEEPLKTSKANYAEEWQGAGVGAIAGAIIGGPAGIVVGLTGGALFGRQAAVESKFLAAHSRLEQLESTLLKAHQQRQNMEQELALTKKNAKQLLEQFALGFVLNIAFRSERSELEGQYIPQLEKLAQLLKQVPALDIHVNAYTDARGSHAYNQYLALQRADSIRAYIQKLGIDTKRINSDAHGEVKAKYPETDVEGTGFDRHVLITLCVKEMS